MAHTYILKCSDGTLYVGSTDNLSNRMKEHQGGHTFYTKTRLPVELVYTEEYHTRDEAAKRERQIKKWSNAKKQALIDGNFDLLKSLCKKPTTEV